MNAEDKLDDFLKDILKTGGLAYPPSEDYTQKVMRKVETLPVMSLQKQKLWLIVVGVGVFLTLTTLGIYWAISYWSMIQHMGVVLLQKLPFGISVKALVIGFIYLLLSRILLALGILALTHQSSLRINWFNQIYG